MFVQKAEFRLFLWLSNIPLCIFTTSSSNHLSKDTPLISGAAVRFEGQIAIYRPDKEDAPCYACLFSGERTYDEACALFGVFSPLVGIIGSIQASEALKLLMSIGDERYSELLTYDALENEWQRLSFKKNPHCPVCSNHSQ